MFSLEERVELAETVLADFDNVEVMGYTGLTVGFAKDHELQVIIRGTSRHLRLRTRVSAGQHEPSFD